MGVFVCCLSLRFMLSCRFALCCALLRFFCFAWGFIKTAGKTPFAQGRGVPTLEGSAEQQKERNSKKSGTAKRAEQQKERTVAGTVLGGVGVGVSEPLF